MQTLGSPPGRGTAAGTGITQRGPKKSLQKGEFFVFLVWSGQLPSSVGLGLLLLCSQALVFCTGSNRDQFMAVVCMDGAPVLGFLGPLQQIVVNVLLYIEM